MLEFTGVVEKIEKTHITNMDLISFNLQNNPTKMQLEMVTRINPFKVHDSVTINFDTTSNSKDNPKLILSGYLYAIKKDQGINKIFISIGGLQLTLETSEDYEEFKTKKDLIISFF